MAALPIRAATPGKGEAVETGAGLLPRECRCPTLPWSVDAVECGSRPIRRLLLARMGRVVVGDSLLVLGGARLLRPLDVGNSHGRLGGLDLRCVAKLAAPLPIFQARLG